MKIRMICTLIAVVGLLVPVASAAAQHAPDDAGVASHTHTSNPSDSSDVVEGACFRVPLNWLIADSGPLPTCRR